MNHGIRSALIGLLLALSASSASAALSEHQIEELDQLVNAGNVAAIINWWKANLDSIDLGTPLEQALNDFVKAASAGQPIDPQVISLLDAAMEQY